MFCFMTFWNRLKDEFVWFFNYREKYNLEDIFTSGSPATINYIRRPKLEGVIDSNLKVKGRQLAIFGHSGSGKTTIIQKVLKEQNRLFVISHCHSNSTFEDLVLSAFDELNPYYIDITTHNKVSKISSTIQTEYSGMKNSIVIDQTETFGTQVKRILPVQLTPQKLSDFLGEAHCCWIIEDFHKVKAEERQKLADSLKTFVDQGVKYPDMKIICIGAVGSVNELLQYDTNLNTRIAEIEVPLLSDDENKQLIKNGCHLLYIRMDDKMVNDIISYSNRIGSVAHQMCYDICYKSNLLVTQKHEFFLPYEKFADALQSYIESQSDRLHCLYEGAIRADIGWYILRTLANTGCDKVSIDCIFRAVNQNRKHKQFSKQQVCEKLQELSAIEVGIVKYDTNSDKYSLSSPFWGAFIKMQQRLEYNKSKKRKILIENQEGVEAILHNMILTELQHIQQMLNYNTPTKIGQQG